MNGDIFENTSKNSINNVSKNDASNFFLNQNSVKTVKNNASEPIRHLNDYDFNILKEGAYKDVSDEILKLEYKMSRVEKDLNNISEEIHDFNLADNLYTRKIQLEEEYKILSEQYKQASLSAKISGGITSKIKNSVTNIKNTLIASAEVIMSKLPGKISSFMEIKSSLSKLSDINKCVDELMENHYPIWENDAKYERLSKYILKANSIQAEITKFLK